MASSGIPWIDNVFDWSVIALVECAKLLGITYEEINVWLFCLAILCGVAIGDIGDGSSDCEVMA